MWKRLLYSPVHCPENKNFDYWYIHLITPRMQYTFRSVVHVHKKLSKVHSDKKSVFAFPWMYFHSLERIFIPLNIFSFPWMCFHSFKCIFIPLNVFAFPWMYFLSPKCIFIPLNVLSCPEMYFPLRSHLESEIDFYWPSNIFVC